MLKKIVCFLLVVVVCIGCFAGCDIGTESSRVNRNLTSSADNFECYRRITVYNARTDLIVLELVGLMSLSNNSHNELIVTCKTGDDEYKKNYIYLNEYVIYVVEDITSTVTDPYHYEIHYYTALPDISINE